MLQIVKGALTCLGWFAFASADVAICVEAIGMARIANKSQIKWIDSILKALCLHRRKGNLPIIWARLLRVRGPPPPPIGGFPFGFLVK